MLFLTEYSDWVPNDGIDDTFEEEDDEVSIKSGLRGTIYLIDADKEIIEDGERFRRYLNCIEQDLLKNIANSSRDLVSIVFYNTEKSPEPNELFRDEDTLPADVVPSNCAILIPLKQLNKDVVQCFKNFRESEDFFDFFNKFGTSQNSNFSEALWLCSRMFIRCSRHMKTTEILLFTANAQPHMPGTPELQQAFVRAEDLKINETTVSLVPLVDANDAFDMDLFYIEFICAVNGFEKDEFRWHSPSDLRYLLENRLFRRNFRKNCMRHINWEIAEDLLISCEVHSFTRRAVKPSAIKIDRATNDVVISKRSYVTIGANPENANAANEHDESSRQTQDSGIAGSIGRTSEANPPQNQNEVVERQVMPGEMYRCQTICGKEIHVSAEEFWNIKSITKPGIRLLGFKPMSMLEPRWFMRHCCFLYPEEHPIKGSTKFFRGLWEKCLEKEKYALCVMTLNRKGTPRYIALVPQTYQEDKNDGFRIIQIPVETNIGYLDAAHEPVPEISEEMVTIFEKICKKLRFLFTPQDFANPSLKAFYSQMEALVFDENEATFDDDTLPNVEAQDEKIAELIQQFNQLFEKIQGKRSNVDGTEGGRAKSAKKELSMSDIENALRMNQENVITVQNLKDFITSKKARVPSKAIKKNLFEYAKQLIQ